MAFSLLARGRLPTRKQVNRSLSAAGQEGASQPGGRQTLSTHASSPRRNFFPREVRLDLVWLFWRPVPAAEVRAGVEPPHTISLYISIMMCLPETTASWSRDRNHGARCGNVLILRLVSTRRTLKFAPYALALLVRPLLDTSVPESVPLPSLPSSVIPPLAL